MHGIASSAQKLAYNIPSEAAIFLAVDAGYDVWMGNARGNTYSRKHTDWNPDKNPEFWEFSFYEMGLYDVPAFMDRLLEVNGSSKVAVVAHSMGAIEMYTGLAELEDYFADKVSLLVTLAGPATFANAMPALVDLANDDDWYFYIFDSFRRIGFYELSPMFNFIYHVGVYANVAILALELYNSSEIEDLADSFRGAYPNPDALIDFMRDGISL